MRVAMSTIWHCLVINSQVCNFWEQTLLRAQWELFMSHDGVVSSNCHHPILLVFRGALIWAMNLSNSLRSRNLTVRKKLAIISTGWNYMCNLLFSTTDVKTHLLLLSSTLRSNTVIGLLMRIGGLRLLGKLLSIVGKSIWMRAMTVTLPRISILSKDGLMNLLRLNLLIISIHRSLQWSETSCTSLHWLTKTCILKHCLISLSWSSNCNRSTIISICLSTSNHRWASFIFRVICIHI